MSPEPLTVLHASDYQVGRPYLPEAADAHLTGRPGGVPVIATGTATSLELGARKARVPWTLDEAKVGS